MYCCQPIVTLQMDCTVHRILGSNIIPNVKILTLSDQNASLSPFPLIRELTVEIKYVKYGMVSHFINDHLVCHFQLSSIPPGMTRARHLQFMSTSRIRKTRVFPAPLSCEKIT